MDVCSAVAGGAQRRLLRTIAGLPTCLAVSAALILVSGSPADAALTPSRPADSFVESIGVNTHFYYSDTPYVEQFPIVKQRLSELGVRHIRENIAPDNRPDQYQRLRELAAMGIKTDLILGEPTNGISTLDQMLSTVKTELTGALDAVEGPNEFDASGLPNWEPMLREYQQHLYTAVKSDPSLSSLTVVAPSIVSVKHEEELGDISGMTDVGNIHAYTDGEPPEKNAGEYLERAALNAPGKPLYATEAGYNTALQSEEGPRAVSEAAMATYIPRVFLENFRLGFARTLSYELLDEFPDPELTHREWNWGLLRNDLSRKPAFDALRNLIAILKDPGPAFSPEPLEYSISGNQTGLRQVLLQKRDGSFYLALWRATSVWNPSGRIPIDATPKSITLYFGRRLETAARFVPTLSSEPVEMHQKAGGHELAVEVGPDVTLIRLTTGPQASPRIKAWVSRRSVPAGTRVSVKGQVPEAVGQTLSVKIQRWSGGWHTVGRGRTSGSGAFAKAIRLSRRGFGSISRIRVVAPKARPSRPIRVRVRNARMTRRAQLGSAKALLKVG